MNAVTSLTSIHAPLPPAALSLAFVVLVGILYLGILGWLRGAAGIGPRGITFARAAFVAWLALTAAAAMAGLLDKFDAIPPRLAFVVLPALLAVLIATFHPGAGPVLDRAPGLWLVGFQTFRVAMEVVLWRLAAAGVIPASMTFAGRNFDIVVGLTAPLVAWLAFSKQWVSPGPVILWNVLGIALLGNVVVIGFLSAPTCFRQFFEGPPNEMVAGFPFVWLVSFVVPVAFLGHLLSIRQQVRVIRTGRAERAGS